jgi:hypothetical protein
MAYIFSAIVKSALILMMFFNLFFSWGAAATELIQLADLNFKKNNCGLGPLVLEEIDTEQINI